MTNDVVEHNILWSDGSSSSTKYNHVDGSSPVTSDNLYQNTQVRTMTTSGPRGTRHP